MLSHGRKGKVLVIDDERLHREMLKEALSEGGFDVFTACDGEEGLRLYKKELPQLVITDLIMPKKGGVSTGVEISKYARQRGQMPIVVLFTAMFKKGIKEFNSPEMGASVHMSKDLSPVDVTILVEQLIERKNRRNQEAP